MTKALECIDECIVIHEYYRPTLITKAHILMVVGDWRQALDLAERAIDKSKGRSIDAFIITSLFYLVRAGDAAEVRDQRLSAHFLEISVPINSILRNHVCVFPACDQALKSVTKLAELIKKSEPMNRALFHRSNILCT